MPLISMNILIVSTDDPSRVKSGIPRVTCTHARALTEKGYNVILLCRGKMFEDKFVDNIRFIVVPYEISNNPLRNLLSIRKAVLEAFDKIICECNIHVIHGHDYIPFFFIIRNAPVKIKKIFTVHDPLVYHQTMLLKIGGGCVG